MSVFEQNELPAGLNKKRLVALLKAFGEYPAKYRWKSLFLGAGLMCVAHYWKTHCMIHLWICFAGCLYGDLCCVSQRTMQHTAVWLIKACIQPTSLCMINTPLKVRSYRGDCRGTDTHTHNFSNTILRLFTCWKLSNLLLLSSFSMNRVLSALAHWAAIFGEVEYLPLVAFPFVKLFQNNPMLCFEVVATVIGTCWFQLGHFIFSVNRCALLITASIY